MKFTLIAGMILSGLTMFAQSFTECTADFQKMLKGEKSIWTTIKWTKPAADITMGKGELKMVSKGAVYSGVLFEKMIPVKAPLKLKVTFTASGKGLLRVGFWEYNEKTQMVYTDKSARHVKLTAAKQTFSYIVEVSPKSVKIRPMIYIPKNSAATITSYKIEAVK